MAKKTEKTPVSTKRPPVIVVLGHVDHGKTTLLDTIRKANVAGGEAGGITQHIGAYQTQLDKDDPNSVITFIDTPGHEAFSKMRSRGASVADIAILVVAANDGVKPQTKEAIAHIKKAKLPFVVAINKVDLEGVNLDVVKAQLAENDVLVEGYGGDVVALPISAKKNQGVAELLEMIRLIYDLAEINNESKEFRAVVLESYIDNHKGVVANILVRTGELNIGDTIYEQQIEAKVRSLMDDKGKLVEKAVSSQPVQVLGFKHVPVVGSVLTKEATNIPVSDTASVAGSIANPDGQEEKPHLKIILKTDVAGTLEAIKAAFTEEVELVGEGIGDISDSDVLLARSTGARLIGFHVKVSKEVNKLAEMEEVKIETFDVIYHLLEDLQKRVLKLMEPTINEEPLGNAEIIAEFKIRGTHIAGCKVIEGIIRRTEKARVKRGDKIIAEPRIAAQQVDRKDAAEAKKGQEVALVFRPDFNFKLGDIIESYRIVED